MKKPNETTENQGKPKNPRVTSRDYAQSLIVVRFWVLLVITRYHEVGSGRKLEETFLLASRTFLNQHFSDQTAGKPQKSEPKFREKSKNSNEY